ncbi:MAG: hypothetical protein HY719_16145 [Planctomycetes bacterium]|nr:hypothetical protein [Planctomycetota bacterium]
MITSPPYCNRYDSTRTYALELALLGVNEADLSALRQAMITCTVENRTKHLFSSHSSSWGSAINAADRVTSVGNEYLQHLRSSADLETTYAAARAAFGLPL